MIGALVVLVLIGLIGWYLWWERTEKSRKRQVFFAIYNAAMAKASDKKDNLTRLSVNILDLIDETDIAPTAMHTLLKDLESKQYLKMSSHTVKLTTEGIVYFRYNYLSEDIKNA